MNNPEMRSIILDAQAILARHLPPDGVGEEETIRRLLGLFDGQRCREALDAPFASRIITPAARKLIEQVRSDLLAYDNEPAADAISDLLRAHDALAAQPQAQQVPDDDCICKGNWRQIIAKCHQLIGKTFDYCGDRCVFFGLVYGDDDYYYGLKGKELHLLSCVGSLETWGCVRVDDAAFAAQSTDQSAAGAVQGTGTKKAAMANNVLASRVTSDASAADPASPVPSVVDVEAMNLLCADDAVALVSIPRGMLRTLRDEIVRLTEIGPPATERLLLIGELRAQLQAANARAEAMAAVVEAARAAHDTRMRLGTWVPADLAAISEAIRALDGEPSHD